MLRGMSRADDDDSDIRLRILLLHVLHWDLWTISWIGNISSIPSVRYASFPLCDSHEGVELSQMDHRESVESLEVVRRLLLLLDHR